MKVTNLTSPRTGAKVANQFMVTDGDTEYFQSYETIIAKRQGHKLTISGAYNYSNTTSKYFKQWLVEEWRWTEEEIKTLKKWLTKATEGDTLEVGNCKVVYINEL